MSFLLSAIPAILRAKANAGAGNTVSGDAELGTNLAGHWSLESNGNDNTAGANNWTANGVTFSGTEADFDGVNDSLTGVSAGDLSLTTDADKTIAIWVNYDTVDNADTNVIIDGNASSDTGAWFMGLRDNSGENGFQAWVRRDGTMREIVDNPSSGTWYLLWVVLDATNDELRTYVNDNASPTTTATGVTSAALEATGLTVGESGLSSQYWDGKMKHLGVWNKAISDAGRSTYYNSGTPLPYS